MALPFFFEDKFQRLPHQDIPLNTDDVVRSCTVLLYRKTIVGPIGCHWMLHFNFGDYQVYYEAHENCDGALQPNWCIGMPADILDTWSVGQAYFSPKTVNDCARRNKHNGKTYIVLKMNCQVWAIELASMLGLSIPIPRNLLSYVPFVADFVSMLQKMGGVFRSTNSPGNRANTEAFQDP